MHLIIDTSVVIDHLRQKKKISTLLTQILTKGMNIKMSLITVGELYSGLYLPTQEKEFEKILNVAEILSIDFEIAKKAGEVRRVTNIGLMDAFTAATAISLGLQLATLNEKDFKKVSGLDLYKI